MMLIKDLTTETQSAQRFFIIDSQKGFLSVLCVSVFFSLFFLA